jgi:hypothetical protein
MINVALSFLVSQAQLVKLVIYTDNVLMVTNIFAGCAVVTLKDAFLFTDGRYFLQAEKQLDR